ncbi:hypothetical protein QMG83_12060 [Salinibacterium sp. G-O1]|uniref:hypothetical protein n=1 Tax=Salinibacterium sp. G-O1 TaxID=3046208 RepID=UPI0024BB2850|nr:hypothetical protein [Salinibacterium sp. G-O1]MDJ0335960.1 hypothetical protein [Salinibacterium sp. G-O1]
MVRILVSIVVALVATVLGYAALWHGGAILLKDAARYVPVALDVSALVFVIGGIALLSVAMLTVGLSSIGVIVVGAIHVVTMLLAVLIPAVPIVELSEQVFGRNSALGDGLIFSIATGTGMLAGAIFLVGGLAAVTRRSQKPGGVARTASVIVALGAGPMGVLLAFMGGGVVYADLLAGDRTEFDGMGGLLLTVGAALLGLALLTLRWSSLGTTVLGLAFVAAGVIGMTEPGRLASIAKLVSPELTTAVEFSGPNGTLALLGVLLIAAAIGELLRSRRLR